MDRDAGLNALPGMQAPNKSKGKNNCCSGEMKTIIPACSGASNVGQVKNSVMIELDKKGMGGGWKLS
jgi:uncharacterized metal-binding protein